MDAAAGAAPRVGLFVTCLVDLFRPSVGFAAVKLLEDAGCTVEVPLQSCCGQPAYNSGDRPDAKALAAQVMAAFAHCDYVVAPSGSCAGMMAKHYPELFKDEPDRQGAAIAFAAKTHELVSFLTDVLGVAKVDAQFSGAVTYHDSCSGLRELGIQAQPRRLLKSIPGLDLVEMPESDVCCGFGGTFSVKYGEISDSIVGKKTEAIAKAHTPLLLAGDLGCLMNMAGKLSRQGSPVAVRHIAEVLAGMTDAPPIGGGSEPPGETR
jgi:L-lactate dehydrogenase complex protein LldE